jgi:putative ATP-dependent endonuclease of the OLD family
MYLNKILIINFRSCNLLSLDFSANEPNVLIGINDCGKSTILKGVEILLAIKPNFNFIKDDKKKNDLSNTRIKTEIIDKCCQDLELPKLEYDEKKCYIIGQFFLEEEDFGEEATSNVSPQLLWLLDNVTNNCIWIGRAFDENTQTIKDIISIPDVVENSKLLKLYNTKDSDLQKKRNELKITDDEIKNDNDKGRYKKMEIARAIYNRYELSWFWTDYDSRSKDALFFH